VADDQDGENKLADSDPEISPATAIIFSRQLIRDSLVRQIDSTDNIDINTLSFVIVSPRPSPAVGIAAQASLEDFCFASPRASSLDQNRLERDLWIREKTQSLSVSLEGLGAEGISLALPWRCISVLIARHFTGVTVNRPTLGDDYDVSSLRRV
jgi:hypothetical protein